MSSFADDASHDDHGLPLKKSVPVSSVVQEITQGASKYIQSLQEAWLKEKDVASKPFLIFSGLGCEATAGDVAQVAADGSTEKGMDWESGALTGSDTYDPAQVNQVGGIVIASFGPKGRKVCVTSRAERQAVSPEEIAKAKMQILRTIRLKADYERLQRAREMGNEGEVERIEKSLKAQKAVIDLARDTAKSDDVESFGSLLSPKNRELLTRRMAAQIVTNAVVRKYVFEAAEAKDDKGADLYTADKADAARAGVSVLKANKNGYKLQSALGVVRRGKSKDGKWNDPRAEKDAALGSLATALHDVAAFLAELVSDCGSKFQDNVACKDASGICGLVDLPRVRRDGTQVQVCFPADLAAAVKKDIASDAGLRPQSQTAKAGRWYTGEARQFASHQKSKRAAAASSLGLGSFEDDFRGGADSVVSGGGGDADSLLKNFTTANADSLSRVFGVSGGAETLF